MHQDGVGSDAADAGPPSALDIVLVTGLSGAGRSTAAKCLEDLGYFVVDNLPPSLIATMVELGSSSRGAVTRLAVVVDVRSRAFSSDLTGTLIGLDERGFRPKVLFLRARDDVLIRRFESVRRAHPLQGEGRLSDGIAAERLLLTDLAGAADVTVDTSDLNVHQLRATIELAFGAEFVPSLKATVMSFGYKYGLPLDADLVVDVRFLPNPHWLPELRPLTGQHPEVRAYVLGQETVGTFLDSYMEILNMIGTGYQREGKRYLTLAVGCTGGKHRSVAISEELAARLVAAGVHTTVVHRDLGRE
ncbi:MAG: RNase adapter RapZ [Geodermatophilaceae bacterium]|nr:RNase adapter RapZ [Geodermatophilaceae bacterium]MDQ3476052.1 RNase adapter RapZ [Actinomycetota bacterium]